MIVFRLDNHSGVPIYRQIQDMIRFGIASGQLCPGEQLPTVRALAVELAVNPNTVIRAYTELEREGIVMTEHGTGTFVSEGARRTLAPAERQSKLDSLCSEFLAQAARYGFSPDEVVRAIRNLTERRKHHG
jgi:GntR family transcriptional regulator